MGQLILPTPLSTNSSSSSPTTDDIQSLLHYNAAQLANTSRNSAAARCHQLFNDAQSASSSGPEINQPRRLLDSMDCFQAGLEKNPGLKKKTSPVVFLRFFWVFCFFWVFGFLYIFAEKREFLGVFQFQKYF
jgi:hypothetical protein